MKKIRLNQHFDKTNLSDGYELDPTEKYVINLEEEIYQLVGHPFNIASPKQLQEVLFSELGLIPDKKTKTDKKKILFSQNGPVVVSQWQPRKLNADKHKESKYV